MLSEWAIYFIASLASVFLIVGVAKRMAFFTLLSFGLWVSAAMFSPMVFTALGPAGEGVFSPEFALVGYVFWMVGVVSFLVAIAQAFDKL